MPAHSVKNCGSNNINATKITKVVKKRQKLKFSLYRQRVTTQRWLGFIGYSILSMQLVAISCLK